MNPLPPLARELGDGLLLRTATRQDTAALVDFQIHAFANPDTGELDDYLGGWTRDLMKGKHPTFQPGDFLVVEETRTRKIVSCSCLITQTWQMQEIPFKVGRVELVATAPEYRRKGLVREQFKVLHEWSVQRDLAVQVITGIPYYYRQFGYEYAIELVPWRQTFVPQQIARLKKGQPEPYRVRSATRDELPFIARVYRKGHTRSLLNCVRNIEMFAYEQFGETDPYNGNGFTWAVIETQSGKKVGVMLYRHLVVRGQVGCFFLELLPGVSWVQVLPSVLRGLVRLGSRMRKVGNKEFSAIHWFLVDGHPLYETEGEQLVPTDNSYGWYVRVPDLPALLKRMTALLERRLAESSFASYTGTLRLNFFKSGVAMEFQRGSVRAIQPWQANAGDFGQKGFGNATFPDLTFLKMVFGYRSLGEIHAMFPDCIVDNEQTAALLNVLFPKQASHIVPVH
jgi:hypothetical protein